MGLNPSDIELIEKASLKQLSIEEDALFQSRLSNPAFAKEWKEIQMISEAIQAKGKEQAKNKLKEIEKEIKSKNRSNFSIRYLFWILGVLTAGFIVYFLSSGLSSKSSEQLFIAYYSPYPNEIDPITKSSSAASPSAYQAYETKAYDEAISMLIPKLSDKTARWYFAQAMMANGDLETSGDIFKQFVRSADKQYSDHAKWYLSLVYLKEGKIEEMTKVLNELKNSTHVVYAKRSKELLKQMAD